MDIAKLENLKNKLEAANERVEKAIKSAVRYAKKVSDWSDISVEDLQATPWKELKEIRDKLKEAMGENWRWTQDSSFDDYYRARYKVEELEKIANNYETKIHEIEAEQEKRDSIPRIQVVWDVLDTWGERCMAYYERIWEKFEKVGVPEFKNEVAPEIHAIKRDPNDRYGEKYYAERERIFKAWAQKYSYNLIVTYGGCEPMNSYSPEVRGVNGAEFLKKAQMDIEKRKEELYYNLIYRVTDIVGTIKDAKHLNVGQAGELEGYIIGDEGEAEVWSTGSGGYNIQQFHFRFYVRERQGLDNRHI